MKKYVKPELIFESFELSQQIAACQYDSNNTLSDIGCEFTGYNDWGEKVVIFTAATSCGIDDNNAENGQEVIAESYCYHNSSGGFGIFNS